MQATASTSIPAPFPGSDRDSALVPGSIRVGIGGWSFEPWRNNFYPAGLKHESELEYASRKLSSIEINATYYRLQTPATFAKWRESTPDDFVFSVKASKYSTNRRVLGESGEAIARFLASGLAELGPKLGPVVWQFATTKTFDADDFGAFLRLLPARLGTLSLRHAVEVRHASFAVPEFIALARQHGVAIVFADSDEHPSFADTTADFVYARLMKTQADCDTGYPEKRLAFWADCAGTWARGDNPEPLARVDPSARQTCARDVFVYFISGAKERAPRAAMALLAHFAKPA